MQVKSVGVPPLRQVLGKRLLQRGAHRLGERERVDLEGLEVRELEVLERQGNADVRGEALDDLRLADFQINVR